ncbi:MAG: hypothetical protein MJK14_10385 [Rivularia sp. ALOHA_DT_140]|nr:hypothetical protein [Rivularia sp. ALOHA_DT_140]
MQAQKVTIKEVKPTISRPSLSESVWDEIPQREGRYFNIDAEPFEPNTLFSKTLL